MAIEKIPDQSGDVDLRLTVQPFVHDAVMVYGKDNGVRGTSERYCLSLVHFFILIGRLPQFHGFLPAICGLSIEDERLIQRGMRETRQSREAIMLDAISKGLRVRDAEAWTVAQEAGQERKRA